MIYCFNLGIGWASSGVEYAQAYRATVLRNIGKKAKFIFTDMFPADNIEHMTRNIGFLDSEIIWLYSFFTDTRISPATYTLSKFEETFEDKKFSRVRNGKQVRYSFEGEDVYYNVYMVNETGDVLHRVEIVSGGRLIRKDFYTYCRLFSEYFAPVDHKAHVYQRRFFNEDESIAYDEIIDGDKVMYKFPDKILCSKEELIAYMISLLKIKDDDMVLIDRSTGMGRAIIENVRNARIGVIIHADHFSEPSTNDVNILWNNYYEYTFSQYKHVDFYVTATDAQNRLLAEQFKKYKNAEPKIVTIPVGSLSELKRPVNSRRKHSLITASRLATEKHVDWLVDAVIEARKIIPDVSLDIYGKGGAEDELKKRINENNAGEYIRLMGQHKLDDVYIQYEAYLSASTSEGFGLTLLEAVGSGLPIIGFDVRYGNQTFIDDNENGFRIPIDDNMNSRDKILKLKDAIVKLFSECDMVQFSEHSYSKAEAYLSGEVEKKWQRLIEND